MLLEFIVRTSLIALAVGLVLVLMRIKTASVRHAVWTGMTILMLLLPAFLAWGPRASLPILPRSPEQRTATTTPMPTVDIPAADAPARSAPIPSPRTSPNWFAILYAVGVFTLLLRLAIGTLRTTRLTAASCVVPVTVGFFRPRIILPESSSDWPPARLDAVLIHEQAHARRRDPLFQWIALLNRALFWFHPLAWWLERRLAALAEEACDNAVLAHGHDPHDYSEILLDLSRSVELAGHRVNALAMPMPGAFLPQRIRRMLSGPVAPKISGLRLALTVTACAAAAAALSSGTLVRAQSKSQPGPTFEVVSIRPSTLDDPTSLRLNQGSPGTLNVEYPLPLMLQLVLRVKPFQIIGAPAWVASANYAVIGKTTRPVAVRDMWPLLLPVLEDRLQLKFHREMKEMNAYELSISKSGKLPAPQPQNCFDPAGPLPPPVRVPFGQRLPIECGGATMAPMPGGNFLFGASVRMAILASHLTDLLGRPVVDKTGFAESFDFELKFESAPGLPPRPANAANPSDLPDILTALQDQLGLKVKSAKDPVEVIVIDRIEKPSEN